MKSSIASYLKAICTRFPNRSVPISSRRIGWDGLENILSSTTSTSCEMFTTGIRESSDAQAMRLEHAGGVSSAVMRFQFTSIYEAQSTPPASLKTHQRQCSRQDILNVVETGRTSLVAHLFQTDWLLQDLQATKWPKVAEFSTGQSGFLVDFRYSTA